MCVQPGPASETSSGSRVGSKASRLADLLGAQGAIILHLARCSYCLPELGTSWACQSPPPCDIGAGFRFLKRDEGPTRRRGFHFVRFVRYKARCSQTFGALRTGYGRRTQAHAPDGGEHEHDAKIARIPQCSPHWTSRLRRTDPETTSVVSFFLFFSLLFFV